MSFRRTARWDGVIVILAPGQNRAILPEEVSEIKVYTQRKESLMDADNNYQFSLQQKRAIFKKITIEGWATSGPPKWSGGSY